MDGSVIETVLQILHFVPMLRSGGDAGRNAEVG
jgi:hypothetical protein